MTDLVEEVRNRYARAARARAEGQSAVSCCGPIWTEEAGAPAEGAAASAGSSCCGDGSSAACADPASVALRLGYSADDVARAGEGNLGLGCGNPIATAAIRPGMTVLDLGSGAGFDAFLAAERVGPTGRVLGVDMTPEMLALARRNAAARGTANVEFREGRIEALPVEDASVDLVISNCVINLSVDKAAVFREIARVLKPGGKVCVSDLVLVGELPDAVRASVLAYVGCIAGARPLGEYVTLLHEAGLVEVAIPRLVPADAMVEGLDVPEARRAGRVLVSATVTATRPVAE